MRADRVHKNCPIVVCGKTMCTDLVELTMNDFDIIPGMDLIHKCDAIMDCHSRVVSFHFHSEEELV